MFDLLKLLPFHDTHIHTQTIAFMDQNRGRCGRDRMVFGFTTTCVINAYHHWRCEFDSRSWGDILDTPVCDQVCRWLTTGFLRVLQFPPPIKLTTTLYLKYCWKWCKTPYTNPNLYQNNMELVYNSLLWRFQGTSGLENAPFTRKRQ